MAGSEGRAMEHTVNLQESPPSDVEGSFLPPPPLEEEKPPGIDPTEGKLSIQEIMAILPHRYPFLLIDRIDERIDLNMARGFKQLSLNEEFFQGHFPDDPQMPFSLVLEAMAQVGAASIMAHPSQRGRYILFAGLDNAEFGRPPVPGESLDIKSVFLHYRKEVGRTRIVCRVDEEVVVEADFCFVLADLDQAAKDTDA